MFDTTVLIPVYDPNGLEKLRLQRLIDSISTQTLIPTRVVFGANHNLEYLQTIASRLNEKTKVDFLINSSTGAAANMNQLMAEVDTTYTKFMFQDDFFSSNNSLSEIIGSLAGSGKSWIASGCSHFYEQERSRTRTIVPKFSRKIIRGVNSIGAPSVVASRTDALLSFNAEMVYMFDCEWYLRMKHNFGAPAIIKKPLIDIGIHDNQATHWAKASLSSELEMCRTLHKVNVVTGKCSSCKRDSEDND